MTLYSDPIAERLNKALTGQDPDDMLKWGDGWRRQARGHMGRWIGEGGAAVGALMSASPGTMSEAHEAMARGDHAAAVAHLARAGRAWSQARHSSTTESDTAKPLPGWPGLVG